MHEKSYVFDYSKQPSQTMLRAEIKTQTLMPYEIIRPLCMYNSSKPSPETISALSTIWNALMKKKQKIFELILNTAIKHKVP